MLKCGVEVRKFVTLQQKYLAILSRKHGLRSILVESRINDILCSLPMRVFGIETVYRSRGNLTAGIDNIKLTKETLLKYIDFTTVNSLLKYKCLPIRRIFIPKKFNTQDKVNLRPLGIPTIGDRIIQTLFLQVLEPIIDVHADMFSFGFRKGRNAHQAIGELSKLLYLKPINKRKRDEAGPYFSYTKYVVITDIKAFFDNVSHT